MIRFDIPGFKPVDIEHVVFDYNGTIAVDGRMIKGVKQGIAAFCDRVAFHVITADTFGFVEKELAGVNASLTIIPKDDQARAKKEFVLQLGAHITIGVGNGANDRMMLKESGIGIAVLQDEGLAVQALVSADLVVKNICDVFDFLNTPDRMVASLRT